MRLDPAALRSADDVRAVLACVPSQEEAALFGAFLRSGGNASALSDAERFCLELMAVRRLLPPSSFSKLSVSGPFAHMPAILCCHTSGVLWGCCCVHHRCL